MAFYAVSTKSGKEKAVANSLAKQKSPHIHAVLAPQQLNAYVIIESDGEQPVSSLINDIPSAKKLLPGKTSLTEVKSYLKNESQVSQLSKGDLIEITGGAYAGKPAKVLMVNTENNEAQVELYEEPIPMPINITGEQFRMSK